MPKGLQGQSLRLCSLWKSAKVYKQLLFLHNMFTQILINFANYFENACTNGQLCIAKMLFYFIPHMRKHISYNYTFRVICSHGHLEVAKWLLEVHPNMIPNYEFEFALTCQNGHLEVAQWLLQINPTINISAINEHAFRSACFNGHLEVAQWLRSLMPFKYIIVADGNPHIIPQKTSVTLALISLLKTKGYAQCLIADIVCAIVKQT